MVFALCSEDVLKRMKWLAEESLIDGVQRHLECSDPRRKIRGLYITGELHYKLTLMNETLLF